MALAFPHSLLSIRADGARRTLFGLLGCGLLLGVWLAWFFLARLTVYQASQGARVEVLQAAHVVGAPVGGRVVASRLELGRRVREGEVLVELESQALRLEAEEARTRLAGLTAQLGPLQEQLAAQERALAGHQQVAQARIAEARARLREAQATARLAAREAAQARRLQARGVLSMAEATRERTEAKARQAVAEGARRGLERVEAEQRSEESLLRAEVARLSREVAQLEGQRATEATAVEVLAQRIAERTIRAPISGRLGEAALLQVGSVVEPGSALCTIVPSGSLKIVAGFPPANTLGRVRPGQPARVQLAGFPWPEYGSIPATVSGVASEVRKGLVRVELSVQPGHGSAIPLQHGLPGRVEVEVERASPAELLLRSVGRRLRRGEELQG